MTTSHYSSQDHSHRDSKLLSAIASVSGVGAIVTGYQTYRYFQVKSGAAGFHSFCDLNAAFDCTTVELSKFAEIVSGVPVSSFATAGFLFIALIAVFGLTGGRTRVRTGLLTLVGIATVFSIWSLVTMGAVLHKWCLICLGVDALIFGILALAFRLPKDTAHPQSSDLSLSNSWTLGLCSTIIAGLSLVLLNTAPKLNAEDLNDIVQNILTSPQKPITLPINAPTVGPETAPVTLVKMSDYQCPSCRMAAMATHPLLKKYQNQVRFVFLNYPLDIGCNPEMKSAMHPAACEAAKAALCGQKMGKFMQVHETLFEHQDVLSAGQVSDLVSKHTGINAQDLDACMKDTTIAEQLRAHVLAGKEAQIQATPTFFVNGHKIEGGLPTQVWVRILDELLK